jgi:hypothetical protein
MQVLICYSSNVFFFITAGRSSFLWIDANDIMVEGEWRSSDGSLLTFTGFHPTEPVTRPRLEPTIYRTRGNHANHYLTDEVQIFLKE